jgi:hypothetical protein
LTQLERLAALPFVLVVAVTAGALAAAPTFFLASIRFPRNLIALLMLDTALKLFWFAAAVLLWWTAVSRRRYTVWSSALQLMAALTLADLVQLALGYVVASIQTKGEFVTALLHAPLSASSTGLVMIVIRSPIWLVGAAALVALGRSLVDSGDSGTRPQTASMHPETVT